MPDLITLFTLLCSAAICARLLTYKRQPGTRHRPAVGICAWVLIASTGGQALQIALAGANSHPSIWQLGVLVVLVILSFRAHGNVARIMRVD